MRTTLDHRSIELVQEDQQQLLVANLLEQAPTQSLVMMAKQYAASQQVRLGIHQLKLLNDWIEFAELQLEHSSSSSDAPSPVLAKEITNIKSTAYNVMNQHVFCLESALNAQQKPPQWTKVLCFQNTSSIKVRAFGTIKSCAYGKIKRGAILQEVEPGKFSPVVNASLVAVKISNLSLNSTQTRITGEAIFEDAERELAILSMLSRFAHPHILELTLAGRSDDLLYTVTPLGQHSLWDKISSTVLAQTNLLEFLHRVRMQIGSALCLVHLLGFAHRDVSLENILEMPDGTLKLIDFGLCVSLKLADKASGQWLPIPLDQRSGDGRVFAVGKMRYLAPEFFQRGLDLQAMRYDAQKADVFSLGVCLFVIAYRAFPYQVKFREATLDPNVEQLRKFWNDHYDEIKLDEQVSWLAKMLCVRPGDRVTSKQCCA